MNKFCFARTRRSWRLLSFMLAVFIFAETQPAVPDTAQSLSGRLLVASPSMKDPGFAKTVILMVRHNADGAFGLIVNRATAVAPAAKLLQFIIGAEKDSEDSAGGRQVRVHYGGPVQPRRWFFLHSNDYTDARTNIITEQVSLTSHPDILRALAKDKGPAMGFLALGYAGWGPGQLESEMARKDWITVAPDGALILDDDMATKWRRALDKRGVDL